MKRYRFSLLVCVGALLSVLGSLLTLHYPSFLHLLVLRPRVWIKTRIGVILAIQ